MSAALRRSPLCLLLVVLWMLAVPGTASASAGAIRGTITDQSGAPVGGATVYIRLSDGGPQSQATTTDASGHYAFEALDLTSYFVDASSRSVRPELLGARYPGYGRTPVSVAAADARSDVDVQLPLGATVAGRVTRADDAQPLDQICVEVGFSSAVTDANGAYRVVGVAPGSPPVAFRDCRFPETYVAQRASQQLTLALGQTVEGVDESLRQGGFLSGRLTDQAGAPLPGACVEASYPGVFLGHVRTIVGSDGSWRVGPLFPGSSFVLDADPCSQSSGLAPVRLHEEIALAAGATVSVGNVVLDRAGSLSGTVTDQLGRPVPDACPYAVDSNGERSQYGARTAADGTYRLGSLHPGTWSVQFLDCGAGFVSTYLGSVEMSGRKTVEVVADQDRGSVDQQVQGFTLPSEPLAVSVTRSVKSALFTWVDPQDTGHTAITRFLVTTPQGTSMVWGTTHAITVYGLVNAQTYTFRVSAINVRGTGPEVAVVGLPVVSRVTLQVPAVVTAGNNVTVRGSYLYLSGSGSPYVNLAYRDAGVVGATWRVIAQIPSRTTGSWDFIVVPKKPTQFRVTSYDGTAPPAYGLVRMAGRITVSLNIRRVTVLTGPVRPYAVVQLQRRSSQGVWTPYQNQRLDGTGRLVRDLPSGIWRYVTVATPYWTQVVSSAVTVP